MRSSLTRDNFDASALDEFWHFVYERQMIWHRRSVEHRLPPWTKDPILQKFRFTNVYRELDPGTKYVVENVLEKNEPNPDKIFNVMLYRLIGRAETHLALGFQRLDQFSQHYLESVLKRIRDSGKPPFTAAYVVGPYIQFGSRDKAENVARVFAALHAGFGEFYQKIETSRSADAVFAVINSARGFGEFLSFQVLVDLLYPISTQGYEPLLPYSHDDWAIAGPGAKRGIRLLVNGTTATDLDVMLWLRQEQHQEFDRLELDFPFIRDQRGYERDISLANIQNCLCEFYKYTKITNGTGRARRKFIQSMYDPQMTLTPLLTRAPE